MYSATVWCGIMSLKVLSGVVVLLSVCNVSMATPVSDIACSSSCPKVHPQQHFCNSDTVLKMRVLSSELINANQEVVALVNESAYYRYNARAARTYKEPAVAAVGQDFYFYVPSSECTLPQLNDDVVYVIAGKVFNGTVTASQCDGFATLFSSLTFDQRRGFIDRYENQCDFCQIEAAIQTKYIGGILAELGRESGYWSKEGCVYNPEPSARYGGVDCESLYTFCLAGSKAGECSWEGTIDYDDCVESREDAWFLEEKGETEYTCRSQCDNLMSYHERWYCLKDAMRLERQGNDRC